MADPIVKGFKGAKFGPSGNQVDFSAYVVEWHDSRQNKIARHSYIKRDGGETEPMGRRQHEARIRLAFIGPKWMDTFLALQAVIDENPNGVLTHPVYGDMNAACEGHSDAHLNPENAPNLYELEL